MALYSKTEKPCGNQASGWIHPCPKLWLTPGRVRCSLVPDERLLVSANKCKVTYVSLNECTEKLNQYFWINHRNFSKLDLLFLQRWIKMSNQHNSIIGEKIKQRAEYQQVISNCQCHNYLWEMRTNKAKIQLWENWLRATCLQSFKTQFFTPSELYRLAAPFSYWFCKRDVLTAKKWGKLTEESVFVHLVFWKVKEILVLSVQCWFSFCPF